MGMRPSVIVFYGIDYGVDNPDANKFDGSRRDDDGPEKHETGPDRLVAWGMVEGVQAVVYGHSEWKNYGLALASDGTVMKGDDFEAVEISLPFIINRPAADAILRAYCEKHGLTWHQPTLWAVPYYG